MYRAITKSRPVGSNYRLGGGGGGTHNFFFKMTDLCNEQYSICTIKNIFVQIIGGGGTPPRAPPPIPTGLKSYMLNSMQTKLYLTIFLAVSDCHGLVCYSVLNCA